MGNFEEELERRPWATETQDSYESEEYEEYQEEASEYEEEPVKPKAKKKKKRRKKHPFLKLLVFVLLIGGIVYTLNSSLFNITEIQVTGNKYYTPAQIIELSGVETGKNLIFELKTKDARNKLLESPYIKSAAVDRVPLGTVKITVEERKEYAAVSFAGTYIIIDREGMVLRVTDEAPEITVMEGINVADMTEGKPLSAQQTYLLTGTLELLKEAEKIDIYFKKVFFSSAVVRIYLYDNYYCEGAPENIMDSLKPIKELAETHYAQKITKGVIKVGTNGYLSFSPKID